ncbi:putative Esterase/lipase/thioesterase family active site:lipase (Class 3) [Candidatus Competibacter denitrificans Run_A_D11]|uniref:Esterase/lipase/thioesterase family active site:lipase (Class 3) n=1 Tax=Candidatus Competibacter denitrificans Run_A_D11 TaxID=1400863 RepID=W6MCQ7_9GAMM|nr:hypothetical protein [Candidatus Competibacter denitrificans]CDI04240.1 putative Esterase/lipase/thioesterase family active site:lipase (Class 3) [Candidatus Competibacter denitrificans Run_A_D11]HAS86456.1 hypothetical protein [Candidatus Competibacteraceae bacterium]HRC70468.1 hypothetical protein [Candidatus Competibacter denitrificans]
MRLLMACEILLLTMMVGCTSTESYRKVYSVQEGEPASTQPSSCRNSVENIDKTQHQIAYVELTDQGLFHDRAQFKTALDLLKSRGEKALNIVLYIHGWKHSAACDDENVRHFRNEVLPILADGMDARTVGIYVGWRGAVLDVAPALQSVTFYDRKGAADHIARGSIRELISRLRSIRHAASRDDLSRLPKRTVSLTLIGHSFGGLILYNSIAESLFESAVSANRQPIADLVLLLNPAFEAARFEPLFQAAKDPDLDSDGRSPVDSKPLRPIFVSITSQADLATRIAFPMGRTINTMLQHEGWVSEDEGYTQNYADRIEKVANTHTIGHIERYRTHNLAMGHDPSVSMDNQAISCAEFKNPLVSDPARFPLWNLYANAQVIGGHDDIFQPNLWRFVKELSNPKTDLSLVCRHL